VATSRSDAEYYNDKSGCAVGFLEPRVLLRDEPFAALDALAQRAQNRNRLRRNFLTAWDCAAVHFGRRS